MRWSRNCLTPPERHCRTAYLSGSGPPWALAAGWSTGSRRRRWRSVLASGAVSAIRASRVDCRPSWAAVRLPPASCQLAPAIRNAHAACPSPRCCAQSRRGTPFPGYTFRIPGRSSGTTVSAGRALQAVKAIAVPSGPPARRSWSRHCWRGTLGPPPRCTRSKFLAFLPGTARAYHLASADTSRFHAAWQHRRGSPGPGSGQGI